DALLPAVEDGLVTLIGATTENPYFEVNSALLSRTQVYELRALDAAAVAELLRRAIADRERGLADPPAIDDEALAMLAERAGGDARAALGALERAAAAVGPGGRLDLAAVEDAMQRSAVRYDKGGDRHYDYISAWIKATRNSDVDASVYYLAAMLAGGEDPRFIARRMVIFASEDVGNAAPQALAVASAAAAAVDRVGLPECRLNLAQAAVYLALAPKSNASYAALLAAEREIRSHGLAEPPDAIRDGHYPGAAELGRGAGYRYPHDEPGAVSDQRTLPEELGDARFYEPTDRGFEAELGERLRRLRKRRGA
ncbi:MAG: replication-associated recombination protein A, partial [Thermoleophilia bacterium]|nr:replication-associated recombination protein A [Thermoleophilia bacterium]